MHSCIHSLIHYFSAQGLAEAEKREFFRPLPGYGPFVFIPPDADLDDPKFDVFDGRPILREKLPKALVEEQRLPNSIALGYS